MSTTVRMGIAFLGAYILGRMKKFKLAIAWFGLMTGVKLKLSPDQLLEQGSKLVASSPQLQQLVAALRGPLLEAAKNAAMSTATTQLSGLTDHLADKVENLGKPATAAAGAATGAATQAAGSATSAATTTADTAAEAAGSATRSATPGGRDGAARPAAGSARRPRRDASDTRATSSRTRSSRSTSSQSTSAARRSTSGRTRETRPSRSSERQDR